MKAAMNKTQYRFSASAIDELNRHPDTQRLPTKTFALLIAGLAGLLFLFYLQIVW
jgi:hypothetical protein